MQRPRFKMKLKPGFEAEYKNRHDEIWPELATELTQAGIVKKWWAYMGDIMETNPGNSPLCRPLGEVFHQD